MQRFNLYHNSLLQPLSAFIGHNQPTTLTCTYQDYPNVNLVTLSILDKVSHSKEEVNGYNLCLVHGGSLKYLYMCCALALPTTAVSS